MAASSSIVAPAPESVLLGWKSGDITETRVQTLLREKMVALIANYRERQESSDQTVLDRGPWEPIDYASALDRFKQKKRKEAMIAKNCWQDGFPPEQFSLVPSSSVTGHESFCYQLKEGATPVKGLNSILRGRFSLIDCTIATEIAMYETLHEIFGSSLFNEVFSAKGDYPFRIGGLNTESRSLIKLGVLAGAFFKPEKPEIKLGDLAHFPNLPQYEYVHFMEGFRGLNAICISETDLPIDKKRFVGWGTPPEGMTIDEIIHLLFQEYVKEPVQPSELLSKELQKNAMESLERLSADYKELSDSFAATLIIPDVAKDFMRQTIQMMTGNTYLFHKNISRLQIDTIKYIRSNQKAPTIKIDPRTGVKYLDLSLNKPARRGRGRPRR